MSSYNPDDWVARDPALIARTGVLPFNAETPPAAHLEHDITPSNLHYVRNHSSVPRLDWAEHVLEFYADDSEDMVGSLSMDQLEKEFEPLEIAVTFACDGNRRQELNEVSRSNGFDWGPYAVSTSKWKGALLKEVLEKMFENLDKYEYVHFEGTDDLQNGKYGTGIAIEHAMNPTNDALIAYAMNGERLPPDHGFPVRTILPGFVGGRTVKWLKKITVSKEPSNNWYHLHDNRVYPPFVHNDGMVRTLNWTRATLINQMNLNSIVLYPENGQEISLVQSDIRKPFTVHGIAYDGGGRMIVRVEVSLDSGASWRQCECWYPEGYKPSHGYRYWVMCKWKIDIPIWELASSSDLVVRAWDASFNTQPETHTWNLLGMMNNAWYRLKIMRYSAEHVQVLHPVRTHKRAGQPYGHMEKSRPSYPEKVPHRNYTWEEVAQHHSPSDCWIVIHGKVYDVTDFLRQHPGGAATILAHAGTDATSVFEDVHSEDAHVFKATYVIGFVGQPNVAHHVSELPQQPITTPDGKPVALNRHRWVSVKLQRKESISHDTRRFVFRLASKDHRMWLPWGKHIDIALMATPIRMVRRPYTPVKPILPEEDDGTFELIIKIYYPTATLRGGELSQLLDQLNPDDEVMMKGPEGTIYYTGNGTFDVAGHFMHCQNVNFIAGGTGLTPALAIIRGMLLCEKNSDIKISLVFANKTTGDILCRDELDELATNYPERFKLWHVVTTLSDAEANDWQYGSGYVNEATLRDHCFEANPGTGCFVCGPPGLVAQAVVPNLLKLGFDDNHIFEF